MKKQEGKKTRLWLTMTHASDMYKALKSYNEALGLPIALKAKKFNRAEVGPEDTQAKIGLLETGKKLKGRDND